VHEDTFAEQDNVSTFSLQEDSQLFSQEDHRKRWRRQQVDHMRQGKGWSTNRGKELAAQLERDRVSRGPARKPGETAGGRKSLGAFHQKQQQQQQQLRYALQQQGTH
jgi:hypothetical protein